MKICFRDKRLELTENEIRQELMTLDDVRRYADMYIGIARKNIADLHKLEYLGRDKSSSDVDISYLEGTLELAEALLRTSFHYLTAQRQLKAKNGEGSFKVWVDQCRNEVTQ